MSRILLIEPDKKLASLISQSLKLAGHQTDQVSQAQGGISKVNKVRPDIIILELQLPIHNGIEFLYELRSYSDWQDIPVIIYSQVPPTLKAITPVLWDQLGVVAYHYKPLSKLVDLNHSIDDLLAVAK